MTKKLTRRQKTISAFGRAFLVAGVRPRMVSRIMRANWRNIIMPWRMIPAPMAWALIGLVALAMVLDYGSEGSEGSVAGAPVSIAVAPTGAPDTITLTLGDYIAGETPCEEDAVYDTVGRECIHVDRIMPAFSASPVGEGATGAPATPTASPTVSPTPTASPTATASP